MVSVHNIRTYFIIKKKIKQQNKQPLTKNMSKHFQKNRMLQLFDKHINTHLKNNPV